MLSQYAEEAFNEALRHTMEGSAPRQVAEQDVFGYDHARVGARLAQRWNFPANICAAIADHHAADASPKTAGLSFVVAQANSLCHIYGLWCGQDSDEGARAYGTQAGPDSAPIRAVAEKRLGEPAEVERRVREFLSSAHDRELRWYSGQAPIPNVRDVAAAADDTDVAPDGGGFGLAPDRGRARA